MKTNATPMLANFCRLYRPVYVSGSAGKNNLSTRSSGLSIDIVRVAASRGDSRLINPQGGLFRGISQNRPSTRPGRILPLGSVANQRGKFEIGGGLNYDGVKLNRHGNAFEGIFGNPDPTKPGTIQSISCSDSSGGLVGLLRQAKPGRNLEAVRKCMGLHAEGGRESISQASESWFGGTGDILKDDGTEWDANVFEPSRLFPEEPCRENNTRDQRANNACNPLYELDFGRSTYKTNKKFYRIAF
ncbi:hypothetical protein [Burkholderia ubonensis]|uniref:hypothetical protein n=1 Tax=Burkholderia ubonensis TaxID=101571 RepID=UPI0012F83C58|nr:hypothetical protein [Burkholderia ubonensis]